MAVSIPSLSSKVDPEVKRAISAITSQLNGMISGTVQVGHASTAGSTTVTGGGDTSVIPAAPSNLVATGAFNSIILTWDHGQDSDFIAGFEIWRATVGDLGVAAHVGWTTAKIYADTPSNSSSAIEYFYWVRAISAGDNPVEGPFTGPASASTATDPAYVLEVLAGQISESELASDLETRIDLIDGPSTNPDSVAGRILAEAEARIAAVSSEAAARATAVADEATARSAEIYQEALARIADVDAEALARGAAITEESLIRQDAEESLASSIDTLSAQVNDATTGLPATRAILIAEQTTRADADTALAGDLAILDAQVNNATTGLPATRATLLSEQTTRADADTALAEDISLLDAQVNHATTGLPATRATLLSEQTTRADADTALANDISTLDAQVNHATTGLPAAHALIVNESTARADGDEALAEQIVLLSAGAGEQFDYSSIWYFDSGVESWTGNGTPTAASGFLRPADHATDPYVLSPTGLAITATQYNQIRIRIRKTGTPTFEGALWWQRTTDSTWDAARSVTVLAPTFDANGIAVIPADMGWDGTINQIRIDVGSDQTATDYFEIDWAAVGRPSPGASTAMLYAEQTARANGDTANASSISTLSSQVNHATTGLPATRATLLSEQTTRADADTALASSLSTLSSQVNHATTGLPATLARVIAEESTRASGDEANAGSIEILEASVSTAQTTANNKRRVFIATPVTADIYDIGDLWDRGALLGLWRCITAKAAGVAYNISHWQVVADKTGENVAFDAKGSGNYGFESGTIGLYGAPVGWTIAGNAAIPGANLCYLSQTNIITTKGSMSYGAISSSQLGIGVGWWAIGKRFSLSRTGGVVSVSCAVRILSATTVGWSGVFTEGTETFVGEDDAYVKVTFYKITGEEITITAAEQYSKSAIHQDYIATGVLKGYYNAWITLSHTVTAPADAYRMHVELVATDGGNATRALGYRGANAAVAFDDVVMGYTLGMVEAADSTWAAVAGADVTASSQFALDAASDNVLTPAEKPRIAAEYYVIIDEQAGLDAQATAYEITTEKNAYDTAVAALTTYLATLTTPVLWSSLTGNTTIVGTTFWSKFNDVYVAKQALQDKMDGVALSIANSGVAAAASALTAAEAAATTAGAAATAVSLLNAQVNDAATGLPVTRAAVLAESEARVTGDTALADDIETVQTTVGGHTTSIEEHATSIDGLEAQYTVKIDNNGFMAGFGLASSAAAGGVPFSEFYMMADRVAILNPPVAPIIILSITRSSTTATYTCATAHNFLSGEIRVIAGAAQGEYNGAKLITVTGASTFTAQVPVTAPTPATVAAGLTNMLVAETKAKIPFIVQSGVVYMDVAMIKDATITNAKILELAADKITTGYLAAARIAAGTITSSHVGTNEIVANTANIKNAVITGAKIANAEIGNAHIADAAIDTANIIDANVTTLKIAGNAVIVPVEAYTESPIAIGASSTVTVQSAGITLGFDVPVMINASFYTYDSSTSSLYGTVSLYRNTTLLYSANFYFPGILYGGQGIVSFSIIDSPGAAAATYYLKVTATAAGIDAVKNRAIVLIGCRR